MFDPDTWGTVAAVTSAIGTSGAAVVAATYYIYTTTSDRKSQARHVKYALVLDKLEDGIEATIRNLSDRPIYDVELHAERLSLKELVKDRSKYRMLSKEDLESLKRGWESASQGLIHIASFDIALFPPGGRGDVYLDARDSQFHCLSITFKDALARRWELEMDGTDVTRFKVKDDPPYRWWNGIKDRKATKGYRHRMQSINQWVKENS